MQSFVCLTLFFIFLLPSLNPTFLYTFFPISLLLEDFPWSQKYLFTPLQFIGNFFALYYFYPTTLNTMKIQIQQVCFSPYLSPQTNTELCLFHNGENWISSLFSDNFSSLLHLHTLAFIEMSSWKRSLVIKNAARHFSLSKNICLRK